MKKIHAIVGTALYAVALHAPALSLGASRGTVVLGTPLDLAIEIKPDAGVTLDESCISVQLLDGERPIHSADVRVAPLPSIPGFRPALRIQTQAALRDPVVQAKVQAGCNAVVTRTYTFLVEVPPGVRQVRPESQEAQQERERLERAERLMRPEQRSAAQSAPASASSAPSAPTLLPASAPRIHHVPLAPLPKKVAVAKVPTTTATTAVPTPAPAPAPTPAPTSAPAPAPARLVMEPVRELPKAPIAPTEIAKPEAPPEAPKIDPVQREQEEQKQREQQQQQLQLQMQLNELKTQIAQERTNAVQLRQQLEQTHDESPWLYLLGGALAVMMGVVVWMGRRMLQLQAHAERVWRDSVRQVMARDKEMGDHVLRQDPRDMWPSAPNGLSATAAAVAAPSESASASASESGAGATTGTGSLLQSVAGVPRTMPITVVPSSELEREMQGLPEFSEPSKSPELPPSTETVQIIHPEALFDILQQAEFFESVGENDQAIEVLQKHIAEHGTTSPLSYLELMRLYHQLGRAEDFQLLRVQFMNHFNAEVPAFSGFRHLGRGLEYYVDALAEIEMQWTSPKVVALLEGYLFLRPEHLVDMPPFDLAAFNDLLLLLTIAQTTPPTARGAAGARQRTTPQEPPPPPVMAVPSLPPVSSAKPTSKAPPEPPSEAMLDLNLDWNFEKVSDLPPLPVTPAPSVGEHVGFGMNDEKFELRFELDSTSPKELRSSS